jgi:hypothetical protein
VLRVGGGEGGVGEGGGEGRQRGLDQAVELAHEGGVGAGVGVVDGHGQVGDDPVDWVPEQQYLACVRGEPLEVYGRLVVADIPRGRIHRHRRAIERA